MHLVIVQGPDADRRIELQKEILTIGRGPRCDVVLNDREVSRQHVRIFREGESIKISDLQSSNGTQVNGQSITTSDLKNRDRVQIGRNLMVVVHSNQAGPRPSESQNRTDDQFDVRIVPPLALADSADESLSQIRKVIRVEDPSKPVWSSESVNEFNVVKERSDSYREVDIRHSSDPYWHMMYRAIIQLSHSIDVNELGDKILELIFQGIRCDRACMLLLDSSTKSLRPNSRKDRNADAISSTMQISQTILDYVTQNEEGVLTSDALHDSRWDTSASISKAGIREAICVPMTGRHGLIGVIYIDRSATAGALASRTDQELLNFEHLKLMNAIAQLAALVIENVFNYRAMLQAERMATIGKVTATISHHIKNILQGIEGGSYLVDEALRNQDWEAMSQGWKLVQKNQTRIKSLVLDMLAYGKARRPKLAEYDMNAIVAEVVELVSPTAREQLVQLVFQPASSLANIYGESESLYHAILNLITNGIDACISNRAHNELENYVPQVTVRVVTSRTHVETIISDNGAGLNEAERATLFVAFESTKGAKGTGLGLAVSRKIVAEHGGTIEVTSEPAHGSQFTVRLPIDSDRDLNRDHSEKTISI